MCFGCDVKYIFYFFYYGFWLKIFESYWFRGKVEREKIRGY